MERATSEPGARELMSRWPLDENSSSWLSRLTARRPVDVSRSERVAVCSAWGLEKNLLAAVVIISLESPTETMAEASTRTLIGLGDPVPVHVGRLVGDVQVNVDGLGRDGRAGRQQGDLNGLARPLVDGRAAAEAGDQADRAGVHGGQEPADDDREQDDGEDDDDDNSDGAS